jgi:hypothetical protein
MEQRNDEMDLDNPQAKAYLFELYTLTKGDTEVQVSMYDVGAVLGLEKTDAGAMAEDLFIQGYAELKTLSGGIGITLQGLDLLQVKIVPESNLESPGLGKETILETQGKEALEKILQAIKEHLSRNKQTYSKLEELVMDIKTIEIQMLSPRPKTKIIREVLRSLHENIAGFVSKDLSNALNSLIIS